MGLERNPGSIGNPETAGQAEPPEPVEPVEPVECASCPATFIPTVPVQGWRAIPPGWGLIYGVQPTCSVACAQAYAKDHTASGRLGYNDVAWNGAAREEPLG